jgi:cytochrome c oxidase subunit 3
MTNVGLEGRQGYHPPQTQKLLREGFKLFIVSEVIFFASFFGVFFLNKFLLSGHEDTGQKNINALLAPTINTIILVISGLFAGWSHGVFTKK